MPDVTLTTIAQVEYGEERVPADGFEFTHCRFDGTTLVFSGEANFTLPNCTGEFDIEFGASAAITLNQLAALYQFGMGDFVEGIFTRIRNPGGAGVQ